MRSKKVQKALMDERFQAAVKRIESTPESQAVFAAAKASERGPMCLVCDSKDRRIAELEAQLAEASKDTKRLDDLETLIQANRSGGLILHHQAHPVRWRGSGLGLSNRSLRTAIDDSTERK